MATNITPHNLARVIDATMAYIDDPSINLEALTTEIAAGAGFPNRGAAIIGRQTARGALARGAPILTGRAALVEEIRKDATPSIVNESPYQVNKYGQDGSIANWCATRGWGAFPTSATTKRPARMRIVTN